MSWNYRVLKTKCNNGEDVFAIHEVYYDKKDKIKAYSEDALSPRGDHLDELKQEFQLMIKAFDKPVLVKEDIFKKK